MASAQLSHRYITDRFLPDKAIDLMDEAGSRLRMAVDSKPEELDELDRRILQYKIEIEAQGSGISRVLVRMRKLVPQPLTVRSRSLSAAAPRCGTPNAA